MNKNNNLILKKDLPNKEEKLLKILKNFKEIKLKNIDLLSKKEKKTSKKMIIREQMNIEKQ
jgi:hypothetical protein